MLRTALQPLYPLLSPRPLGLPLVERQSAAWWTETLPLHLESQGVRSFAVVGFSACDSCLEATPPSFGTCPDLGPSDGLEAVYPGHTDYMTNRDFLRTRFFLDLRHTSRRATARDSGTRRAQVRVRCHRAGTRWSCVSNPGSLVPRTTLCSVPRKSKRGLVLTPIA